MEIFDLDQLRSYTLGDRDLEDEVFGLFEAGALDYLTALEAALGAGGEAWRRAAHGFKGSAANLGIEKVLISRTCILSSRLRICASIL